MAEFDISGCTRVTEREKLKKKKQNTNPYMLGIYSVPENLSETKFC